MKIALIYLGRRGGGASFSFEMARGLQRFAKVRAFLSNSVENRERWIEALPDKVFFPVFDGWWQAALTTLTGQRIKDISRAVQVWAPDVLLFPMFHPWNGPIQKTLSPRPAVVVVHDPLPHPGFTGWLHGRVEDISLKRAAICIVLSQSLQPALLRRGVSLQRVGVIPHGGLSYSSDGQSNPNGSGQDGSILFFGRITAYKGLECLLRAFRKISHLHPDARLQIVGDGDLRPYQVEMDGMAGVEVVNRWVADEEIPQFFQAARMVVIPYTSATQSGVIPIAAGFGLPVIATRTGGLTEQIEHHRTGLLVPPADVDELANAIERLLIDPYLGKQLGSALRKEFEDHRNWEVIGEQVVHYCQQAVETIGGK